MRTISKAELRYLSAWLEGTTQPSYNPVLNDEWPKTEAEVKKRLGEALYMLGDLRNAYTDSAEVNLATMEQLKDRKSTPKFDLKRQHNINLTVIEVCERHGLPDDEKMRCPRLKQIRSK